MFYSYVRQVFLCHHKTRLSNGLSIRHLGGTVLLRHNVLVTFQACISNQLHHFIHNIALDWEPSFLEVAGTLTGERALLYDQSLSVYCANATRGAYVLPWPRRSRHDASLHQRLRLQLPLPAPMRPVLRPPKALCRGAKLHVGQSACCPRQFSRISIVRPTKRNQRSRVSTFVSRFSSRRAF